MHRSLPLSHITDQRLSRLSLWLCLTVMWFAANVLARLAPHAAERALAAYAHAARTLLVARALKQTALCQRAPAISRIKTRNLTVRRVVGSTVRRALRGGSLAERARRICALLAAPERWIAAISRRLRRRFTKLRRLPAPPRARLFAATLLPSAPTNAINSS
jgi:hypothetical protein